MRRGLAALLLVFGLGPAFAQDEPRGRPGDFALYVLSLSWSPTFCATIGAARGDEQCDPARPHAFVLHGLWPQYERGWPQFCQGRHPPRIPDGTLARMLDITPSRGLVIHEWQRHGTCSGLAPQAFFDTARRAFQSITIPERYRRGVSADDISPADVTHDFIAANPGLTSEMLSVTCKQGLLEEVRICLSRTLQPRRCAEADAEMCRTRTISVPGANSR